MFLITFWKMLRVVNADLIKKWVYFIYYDLPVHASFCVYIIVVANRLRISTLAEGRM